MNWSLSVVLLISSKLVKGTDTSADPQIELTTTSTTELPTALSSDVQTSVFGATVVTALALIVVNN
jgi:hypothetical protein